MADDLITVRLHFPRGVRGPMPAIISMMGNHAAFLERGWLVVTYRINWEYLNPPLPPPPAPSESGAGKWVLASPSAASLGESYLRTIVVTGDLVIPKIVSFVRTLPEVDPDRLAIVGSSTNGFIVLQALARDRRIGVGVALTACGDYERFLQYSSMGMNGEPLALAPSYRRWVRAHEPIHRPWSLTHAALVMVNRKGDPIIPIQCADSTAAIVEPVYRRVGRSARFRYAPLEGETHGTGQPEYEEMMAWLDRWLASSARNRARSR